MGQIQHQIPCMCIPQCFAEPTVIEVSPFQAQASLPSVTLVFSFGFTIPEGMMYDFSGAAAAPASNV